MASNHSRTVPADSSWILEELEKALEFPDGKDEQFEEARRERLAEMIDDQDSSWSDLDAEENYLAMCRDEEIILYSSRSI